MKLHEEMQAEKETGVDILYIMEIDLANLIKEELLEIRIALIVINGEEQGLIFQTYESRLTAKGIGRRAKLEEKMGLQPQPA